MYEHGNKSIQDKERGMIKMYTNIGLLEYAKKCMRLKTVYVLGEFGRALNVTTINQKCNQAGVGAYNTKRKSELLKIANKGYYAFDCVGLIKSYYWGGFDHIKYESKSDVNESMMLARATKKGKIATIPNIAGVAVVMNGHIGIYDGKGNVYECTPNTKYAKQEHGLGGVCCTKLNDRKWTDWCYIPYITYVDDTVNPSIQADSKVKIKESATIYANTSSTINIPNWVKKRVHTVVKVSDGKVLLKEINSWVFLKDVEGV